MAQSGAAEGIFTGNYIQGISVKLSEMKKYLMGSGILFCEISLSVQVTRFVIQIEWLCSQNRKAGHIRNFKRHDTTK